MRFWDTSALAPLLLEEPRSPTCRRLQRLDPDIAVWAFTRTEIVAAITRRGLTGEQPPDEVSTLLMRLERFARGWAEIAAIEEVRERAERLLARNLIRTSDALQLGAAVLHAHDAPRGRGFVTADGRLARAAAREGFDVIIPR